MIKITFEVSEELIKQKADFKSMLEKNEDGGKGAAIKMMMQMIAFSGIESDIDNGKTEFVVSREKLGEDKQALFDHCIDEVCLLAHFCDGVDEDKKKDQ